MQPKILRRTGSQPNIEGSGLLCRNFATNQGGGGFDVGSKASSKARTFYNGKINITFPVVLIGAVSGGAANLTIRIVEGDCANEPIDFGSVWDNVGGSPDTSIGTLVQSIPANGIYCLTIMVTPTTSPAVWQISTDTDLSPGSTKSFGLFELCL